MPKCSVVTEAEVALVGTTAKTILNVTGSAALVAEVCAIGVSFDGVSATEAPVVVRIVRTTAVPTGTACTEKPWTVGPTPSVAGLYNCSGEGTKESIALITFEVHPQGGQMVLSWPKGEGIFLNLAANAGLSIECTAPTACNSLAWMEWWE